MTDKPAAKTEKAEKVRDQNDPEVREALARGGELPSGTVLNFYGAPMEGDTPAADTNVAAVVGGPGGDDKPARP